MIKVNTEMRLTPSIIEQLEVGTEVFTNGDGNLATQNYIEGKIVAKDGNVLFILRSDGERGGGRDGEWVIRVTDKSEIKVYIHKPVEPRRIDLLVLSTLAFGDVVETPPQEWSGTKRMMYLETLTTGVHVFVHVRGWKMTNTRVERTSEEVIEYTLLGKMPLLKCHHHGCNNPAVMGIALPTVSLLCDEHKPEVINRCHDCGISSYSSALLQYRMSHPRRDIQICSPCFDKRQVEGTSIQNHGYKPRPQFIRASPATDELRTKLFAGVECEVECPSAVGGEVRNLVHTYRPTMTATQGEPGISGLIGFPSLSRRERRPPNDKGHAYRLATVLTKRFNKPMKWFYLKSDGSLSNGFELVTEPATIEAHQTILPWQKVFGFMKAQRIEADQTTSCGLHIHVNKNHLPDDHRIRLGYFVNSQKANMESLARRTQSDYARFKPANTPMDGYAVNTLGGKYEALNWSPRETVEFRLFRGTIEYDTLMSSLELAEALILFTVNKSITELKKKTVAWGSFAEFVKHNGYNFLPDYMIQKGVV